MVRLMLKRIKIFTSVALPLVLIMACADGCESTRYVVKPSIDFAGLGVQKIAVVNVEGGYGREAALAIEHRLVNMGGVTVVTRSQIDKVLRELHLEQASSFSPSEAKKLGELLGVDAFTIGSVECSQGTYQDSLTYVDKDFARTLMTVQLIETETGTILFSGNSQSSADGGFPARLRNECFSQCAHDILCIRVPVLEQP